jgi:hypothetical protein
MGDTKQGYPKQFPEIAVASGFPHQRIARKVSQEWIAEDGAPRWFASA